MDGSSGNAGQSLFRRTRFDDSDELAAAFAAWGTQLTQLRGEAGDQWTASATLDRLRIWSTYLTGRYRVRAGLPQRTVLVQFDLGAGGTRRLGGKALAADDVLVGFAGLELDGVLTEGHHGLSFVLPEYVVAGAIAARLPAAASMLLSTAPIVIARSGPRVAALRALAAQMMTPGPGVRLADAEVIDLLVDTLLLPWHAAADARLRTPRCQRLPIVQRVEDYMHANLGERIMLDDLCRVARASQRALEYSFSAVYGMGPKQYLRYLRLNEVRRTFKSQPPAAESISAIAHRHGFWHMGHFSAGYRALYGETPQQTRALVARRAS
jgi:AraC family ethanolamine operon transcriptional activator